MIRVALVVIFGSLSYAQIGAPQLGMVPDGATLRPVAGIPASASVGSPLTVARNLSQTVAGLAFALAVDGDSGEVLVVTADGSARVLADAPLRPDRMVLSPSGSAGLLWYAAARHAEIVSGLPSTPTLRDMDLSFVTSDPAALAVTDDGLFTAGSWAGSVMEFGPQGSAALPVPSLVAALAFAPGTSDLLLVSSTDATFWNSTGVWKLVTFTLPVKPVAAVMDTRRLIVADEGGVILTVDRTSYSLMSTDCECHLQGLFPLSRSVYRLTSLSGGSFKLLDAGQNTFWFAPLALPAPTSGDAR